MYVYMYCWPSSFKKFHWDRMLFKSSLPEQQLSSLYCCTWHVSSVSVRTFLRLKVGLVHQTWRPLLNPEGKFSLWPNQSSLWGAGTEVPPPKSSWLSKQFYLWSKFHPDITPWHDTMWEKTESLRPSHPWSLTLYTQVNAGKWWWEIILYYRQRVELMDIPLRGFFLSLNQRQRGLILVQK